MAASTRSCCCIVVTLWQLRKSRENSAPLIFNCEKCLHESWVPLESSESHLPGRYVLMMTIDRTECGILMEYSAAAFCPEARLSESGSLCRQEPFDLHNADFAWCWKLFHLLNRERMSTMHILRDAIGGGLDPLRSSPSSPFSHYPSFQAGEPCVNFP